MKINKKDIRLNQRKVVDKGDWSLKNSLSLDNKTSLHCAKCTVLICQWTTCQWNNSHWAKYIVIMKSVTIERNKHQ